MRAHSKRNLQVVAIVLAIVLVSVAAHAQDGTAIHLSDIHFNPFCDSALVSRLKAAGAEEWEAIFATSTVTGCGTYYKNETNYNLLKSCLENMAALCEPPDFIVFTGDLLAHGFRYRYQKYNGNKLDGLETFTKKTIVFLDTMIRKHFPGVPIYTNLGNSDSYAGDYRLVPEGPFLHDTAPIVRDRFLINQANRKSFMATYPTGGSFTAVPPRTPKARIISLNTIFLSVRYQGRFTKYDPARKQLDWLESELRSAAANGHKVWLLLHIPPGADVYGSIRSKRFSPSWKTACNDRFIDLMTKYSSAIVAGLAGHTHMDDFRLIRDREPASRPARAVILICPAVSPQFGNNPAFRQIRYDRASFSIIDYDIFYLDLAKPATPDRRPTWSPEPSFNKTYGQSGVTPTSVRSLFNAILQDPAIRQRYMTRYEVNHPSPRPDEHWRAHYCAIGNLRPEPFERCSGFGPPKAGE